MVQWRSIGARPSTTHDSAEEFWRDIPGADVRVVTSDRRSIPAHSGVLASSSPVLESLVNRKRASGDDDKKDRHPASSIVMPILGVPHNAVVSFLRCLYHNAGFTRCPPSTDEPPSEPQQWPSPTTDQLATPETAKHGVHLLVLSHSFQVPWLKRSSTSAVASSLNLNNVVDMLQLSQLCDAPDLQVRCMALIRRKFKAVQRTEGWRFLQRNDPRLELDVLQWIEEDVRNDRRTRKGMRDIGVYAELGEAMQCLEHICHQGCHLIGPKDQKKKDENDQLCGQQTCGWGQVCSALQQLLLHFAACDKKKIRSSASGGCGCGRCIRVWQLLRLHSAVCSRNSDDDSACKVPFCRQFKEKESTQNTGNEPQITGADRWQVLAKKVGSAKVILTVSKKKRVHGPQEELDRRVTTTIATH